MKNLHLNSSLLKEEKVEKLLDILHEVDKPIEYSDIKYKRYPAFFYKEEMSRPIDNEPNICVPSWDTDSIHINTTKPNTNIEDKVVCLTIKKALYLMRNLNYLVGHHQFN